MVRISATEFQRHVGRYGDVALTEPVTVTKDGRDRVVVLSAQEYRRLKRRDREVLAASEISDADLDAILQAEPPERAKAFDDEL